MPNVLVQKYRITLSLGTGVLLASLFAGESAAQFEEFLLPDMMPWISQSSNYSHGWRTNSSETEFSATTTLLNLGDGHLEFNPDASQLATESQVDVYQTLTRPDGSTEQFLAGSMINHPGHTHWHFEGYAVQRIREVGPGNSVGDIVAEGEKISFCMIDLDPFGDPAETPSSGRFGCGLGTQGISAGWGDIYSRNLSGQQIDISQLERSNGEFVGGLDGSGVYWFEIELDVNNRMIESNNNNNIAQLMIDLNSESVEMDDHANADNKTNATWLSMDEYRFGEVNWNGDTDVFSAQVEEGALYEVSMAELQMHFGDLTVYDTTGANEVFYENVGQEGQQISTAVFRANADGSYFIEVGESKSGFSVNDDGSFLLHIQEIAIAGDINRDGSVNVEDLDILLASWGDTVTRSTGADLNDDGLVNGLDQDIIVANFGNTGGPVAVPEPGSLALLALGGLALARRRRK